MIKDMLPDRNLSMVSCRYIWSRKDVIRYVIYAAIQKRDEHRTKRKIVTRDCVIISRERER